MGAKRELDCRSSKCVRLSVTANRASELTVTAIINGPLELKNILWRANLKSVEAIVVALWRATEERVRATSSVSLRTEQKRFLSLTSRLTLLLSFQLTTGFLLILPLSLFYQVQTHNVLQIYRHRNLF